MQRYVQSTSLSYPPKHDSHCRKRGDLYPATRIESPCEARAHAEESYTVLPLVDSLGFAVFLFSLGYVALEIVFANERRLLSIETELETARQIQASILLATVPELENLRIAGSYQPMTAVAGDFYQFIRSDGSPSRHPRGRRLGTMASRPRSFLQ